jgi:hypothetical protein
VFYRFVYFKEFDPELASQALNWSRRSLEMSKQQTYGVGVGVMFFTIPLVNVVKGQLKEVGV